MDGRAVWISKEKSIIYGELKRNCDKRNNQYRADVAHRRYKKNIPIKNKNISFNQELKDYVIKWIKEDYSPEQIIGAAKTEG